MALRIGIHHHRAIAVDAARAAGMGRSRCVIGILRRDGFAEPERRRGAGTGEIFTLGFARQPVGATDLARQPGKIGFRRIEADALRRHPAASIEVAARKGNR